MMLMKRRDFLKAGAAAGAMASLYGCAGGGKASGHVVVVGGGYGGATVAKYLRMWSEGGVQVTLIERNPDLHLLPDLQPGDRRHQDDGRHHHQLRRPAQQVGRACHPGRRGRRRCRQEDRVAQGRQRR